MTSGVFSIICHYKSIHTETSMGNDSYRNSDCVWNREVLDEGRLVDIVCPFPFLHNSALKRHFSRGNAAAVHLFFFLSAIFLIRDKNQSSTLENSISLMRYEYSSEHKSEIVCCFQTQTH